MGIATQTLAAGGTQTATVTVNAPDTRKKIGRIVVVQTAGSAASYTVDVSTHSAVTDLTKRVTYVTGGTAAAPVDVDNGGNGFFWYPGDDTHANALNRAACRVYVKVTPNAGADNAYSIRFYFED